MVVEALQCSDDLWNRSNWSMIITLQCVESPLCMTSNGIASISAMICLENIVSQLATSKLGIQD